MIPNIWKNQKMFQTTNQLCIFLGVPPHVTSLGVRISGINPLMVPISLTLVESCWIPVFHWLNPLNPQSGVIPQLMISKTYQDFQGSLTDACIAWHGPEAQTPDFEEKDAASTWVLPISSTWELPLFGEIPRWCPNQFKKCRLTLNRSKIKWYTDSWKPRARSNFIDCYTPTSPINPIEKPRTEGFNLEQY